LSNRRPPAHAELGRGSRDGKMAGLGAGQPLVAKAERGSIAFARNRA
jgi:hypothetical protein